MSLISLWKSSPEDIKQYSIEQIVAMAGDGKLRDNSNCSSELREFLSQVTTDHLSKYADYCLNSSFPASGLALQDIVNELGRRLDYTVENGLYQGKKGHTGNDGVWHSPENLDVVLEVKTTDTYRMPLQTIAGYRDKLFADEKIKKDSSVLIVVGREDTGELEAQVRGSRYAWDMRLISVEALLNLVQIKENTEDRMTASKIRSLLRPLEYTRLDALVDVMFTTTRDVETTIESESSSLLDNGEDIHEPTPDRQTTESKQIQAKREVILSVISHRDDKSLIKYSRALYWDSSHNYRIACAISKRYTKPGVLPYWYAYHTNWNTFLAEGEVSHLVLGCMDIDIAFVLPLAIIQKHLRSLYTTTPKNGKLYWHLKIAETNSNDFALQLPVNGELLPINEFKLRLQK